MTPYPLLFTPILKERSWGGRNLAHLGKPLPPGARIGESWELADLPEATEGGRSRIANGPLAGRTLREAIAANGEAIMGATPLSPQGGFPLFVKYLDARANSSVEVHPDDAFAKKHPGTHTTSKAWVVIEARPGAVIYKGIEPTVGPRQLARHIETGHVVDDLVAVPVERGDCHFVRGGTCHALGAGVVAVEIQAPGDTIFRLHDWDRVGDPLHVEPALECITSGEPPTAGAETRGRPIRVGAVRTTPLVHSDRFTIERIETEAETSLEIVTSGIPVVWIILAGSGWVATPAGTAVACAPGTTVLMPATLQDAVAALGRETVLLRVTPPSPLEGLIARAPSRAR
ncbi:MAG: type I phosphomannose isomerase catalytic subunit [Planctomycetota bacterium]|jgi:mannose-6-phosphate isomerase